jgi:hypothetical protein
MAVRSQGAERRRGPDAYKADLVQDPARLLELR